MNFFMLCVFFGIMCRIYLVLMIVISQDFLLWFNVEKNILLLGLISWV